MRRIGYLVLAAVILLGGKGGTGTDIAQLRPVEVVVVGQKDGQIRIQTDTGDGGIGPDVTMAIDNLKNTAPAEIFLDTAEYLLIERECLGELPNLMNHLRPSCGVCILEGEPDLEQTARYLNIHPPKVTLSRYQAGERRLEVLVIKEGVMELVS